MATLTEVAYLELHSKVCNLETGIFNDMWRLATESYGYEQLEYENVDEYGKFGLSAPVSLVFARYFSSLNLLGGYAPDPNTGRFTGLLGAMQNATIDGNFTKQCFVQP